MFRSLSALGSWFTDLSEREPQKQKPQLLLVGYGWATHAFMDRIDQRKYNVRVISERPGRLNQPGLVAALGPSLPSPSSALVTPAICPITQDTCRSVDLSANRVIGAKAAYPYDLLVIAAGSEPNDFKIPGVRQYCHMFKTEEDLRALCHQIESKKTAVILGAGPTGVELACRLRSMGLTVSIVEAGQQILPGFSEAMQGRTMHILEHKGITVHKAHPVVEITQNAIVTKQGPVAWSQESDLLVWTCGVQPVPFVRDRGLRVNRSLQVIGTSNVWAMGDCIQSREHGPPTAQNARQQGAYLADQLNSKTIAPYSYKELGRVLDLTYGTLIEVFGICFYIPADFIMHIAF